MGQQQLLLLILGSIIVGLAIAVAVVVFQDNAVIKNREAMSNDLVQLAVRAQQYYYRPLSMAGGGQSFTGLTADAAGMLRLVSTGYSNNDNATYTITTAGDASQVIIQGVGKTQLEDGSFPTLTLTVTPGEQTISILN